MYSLIFLDFDGVLIGDEARPNFPVRHLDPHNVAILNRLVKKTDARIVLVTAWRHPLGTTQEIVDVLARDGLEDAQTRVIGQTRYLASSRAVEIGEWLITHQHPRTICILDDLPITGFLSQFQVQTDPRVGLTAQNALKAAEMLKEAVGV